MLYVKVAHGECCRTISPMATVYYYFRLWQRSRLWENINSSLRTELRRAPGRNPELSVAALDDQ